MSNIKGDDSTSRQSMATGFEVIGVTCYKICMSTFNKCNRRRIVFNITERSLNFMLI